MSETHHIDSLGVRAEMQTTGLPSNIYNHWKIGSWYERPLLEYWQTLEPPDVYIDIGAHAGNHVVFAGRTWTNADLHALEPDPLAWRTLVRNVDRNLVQFVNCVCAAAGAHSGRGHLEVFGTDEGQKRVSDDGFRIPVIPGDVIGSRYRAQKIVIKIDTEDVNIPVLEGLAQTLERNECRLFIECADANTLEATTAWLTPHGYTPTGRTWGATPLYEWTT